MLTKNPDLNHVVYDNNGKNLSIIEEPLFYALSEDDKDENRMIRITFKALKPHLKLTEKYKDTNDILEILKKAVGEDKSKCIN